MAPLRAVVVLVCVAAVAVAADVNVKIVRAKPSTKPLWNAGAAGHGNTEPTPSRPYDAFAGPEQYRGLVGQCFTTTSKGYQYQLCPFRNVTQKDITKTWNRYYGLLGCVASCMSVCLSVWHARRRAAPPAPATPVW
jgi:hypothetical protein